ncbi:MAG: GNAT family N-acetyltransferase [Anaerolineales bacterium]|nr:GNAT family N-acetyltransferase [Anaerolineales bacterium]MCS7247436.1 GNAT family N-acetyltransferase [Anaerolineales bacterium]MDW8161247.1 GNAT family N-acetyltransferase [Anaerolineales bacterium]MDW8445987.1 GNAT family N-acetyltransferase [Anaerolineales bacterium]
MPQIEIRPSLVSDLDQLLALERDYITQYVCQIEIEENGDDEIQTIRLRRVRLPRLVRVEYPRNRQQLLDEWTNSAGLLVAGQGEQIVGYVAFCLQKAPCSVWITDLVVGRPLRRQGIARALVLAVEEWALAKEQQRLVLEMQSRNDPAIQMAKKFGFEFCGFQEAYYPNGDVALFFARSIR